MKIETPTPARIAREFTERHYRIYGHDLDDAPKSAPLILAYYSGHAFTRDQLEEILGAIHAREIVATEGMPVSDGHRLIWPNESDYIQARDTETQRLDAVITALIESTTGDEKP